MPTRCAWCTSDQLYIDYHDHEWGVPLHDERRLFEMLTLEGAQAGLNWLTILKKRQGYRQAFADFDVDVIRTFSAKKIDELMANPSIIRNRGKIESVVSNATALLLLQKEYGSLDTFLWRYTDGQQLHNRWQHHEQTPAQTELSAKMSKDLKRLGFKFIGPTTCYALMQSIGIVNDHLTSCFRYQQIKDLAAH